MDFQRLLLDVERNLSKDEVKALAFLCTDLLGRSLTSVESASDLFSRLTYQEYLSPERPHLLNELLLTIRRPRLIEELNLTDQESTGLICPYRKLLYELSEELTDDDLKKVKFLLKKTLPRRKLEKNVTTLEVFLEMEHMDLLSPTNLNTLEEIIQSMYPCLKEKINEFKALQAIDALKMPQGKTLSRERVQTANTSSEILGSYPMTAAKRGICLIINNHNFTTSPLSLKNREGTEIDEASLQNVFEWLDFETQVHRDCSSEQIWSLLQDLGSTDHSQMDCVACCILSHGQEGSVYGIDGQTVKLTELREPLNGLRCPSLADKPKMFFIQACQGTSVQKVVRIESDGDVDTDAVGLNDSIPSEADYLFAMSTVPSFVSYRETKSGSWFIQSLCQNLVQMVPSGCDLVSILTKVNADVSRKTDSFGLKKQMPQPAFTLRQKVVFPIPKASAPSLQLV